MDCEYAFFVHGDGGPAALARLGSEDGQVVVGAWGRRVCVPGQGVGGVLEGAEHGVEEAVDAFVGYGGDEVYMVGSGGFSEGVVEVVLKHGYVGEVELVYGEDLGLAGEVAGVLGKFGVYLAVLGYGVVEGAVH